MDGKILFLCNPKKCSTVPKDKNLHIFSSLSDANAIEDYDAALKIANKSYFIN